jgi:hypothetical protein
MVIPLFILILGLQSQQELESRIQQKQHEVDQLTRDLNQERQKSGELQQVVSNLEQELKRPFCSAELRFDSSAEARSVSPDATATVPLNLYSTVSKPAGTCLPAEIQVAASYLDAFENVICSGVVENAATQNSFVQTINLLIRPWNLQEFVRWRNEPPRVNSGFKRLSCLDPEGLAEVNNTEALARVKSVRIRVTVLPSSGGLSSVETTLRLQR